jgi:hypothetical protein
MSRVSDEGGHLTLTLDIGTASRRRELKNKIATYSGTRVVEFIEAVPYG